MKFHRQVPASKVKQSRTENFIAYARTGDGELVHIADVERGLQCQSYCVECQSPLVAKKGQVKRWHFAHLDTSNCQGESVIHAVSKTLIVRLIEDGKLRTTVPLRINKMYKDCFDSPCFVVHSEDTLTKPLVSAKTEVMSESQIVDVMAYDADGGRVAFEIFKTHKKSLYDTDLFKAQRLPAIEIDVSRVPWDISIERLTKHLLNWKNQSWLFHPMQAGMESRCDERAAIELVSVEQEKWAHAQSAILAFVRKEENRMQPRSLTSGASAENLLSRSYAEVIVRFKIVRFDENAMVVDNQKMTITIPVTVLSDRGKSSRLLAVFYPIRRDVESVINAGSQPYLHYPVRASSNGYGFEISMPFWGNIKTWQSALNKIAKEQVNALVAEHDQPYLVHRGRTSKEKLKALLKALKIDVDDSVPLGSYSKCWHANDAVWRAHVLLQCQSRNTSFFSTDSIPGVDVMGAYLGFDPSFETERSKALFFWLRDVLVQHGCAQYAGGLVFAVDISAIRKNPPLLAQSSFNCERKVEPTNAPGPERMVRESSTGWDLVSALLKAGRILRIKMWHDR